MEKKKAQEVIEAEESKEFDFETADRIELQGTFIQQSDLVFFNIPAKGYNKETEVRYALSSDEFIMELRDKSSQKGNRHVVKRVCKTLTKQIDVGRSEVQLLKDFICIKL